MNELYVQFLGYLTSIWRRRWYALAISWLVCGAGWTMVAGLPDKYESEARVYVDMDTMLGPLMKGIAVQVNMFQQIDIMQRTLLSRPNLEKVILMTDLDLKIKSDGQKEALINKLANSISIRQQGRKVASRTQVPLMLAWAITVHKSQGKTLRNVEISLDQAFEHGQVYVALSRATSLAGLRLLNFDPMLVKAHPLALAFYKSLEEVEEVEEDGGGDRLRDDD